MNVICLLHCNCLLCFSGSSLATMRFRDHMIRYIFQSFDAVNVRLRDRHAYGTHTQAPASLGERYIRPPSCSQPRVGPGAGQKGRQTVVAPSATHAPLSPWQNDISAPGTLAHGSPSSAGAGASHSLGVKTWPSGRAVLSPHAPKDANAMTHAHASPRSIMPPDNKCWMR